MGGSLKDRVRKIYPDVPIEENSLDIFVGLVEIQEDIAGKLSGKYSDLDEEKVREVLSQGRPVLSAMELRIDDDDFASAVKRVAGYLREELADAREGLSKVLEAQESGQLDLSELKSAFLRGDIRAVHDAANRVGVDHEMLEAVVAWATQPFFQAFSESVKSAVGFEGWESGRCPVCGSFTRVGVVQPDGTPLLKCQFCGAEWVYPEGKCPYCGNSDKSTLMVLGFGEDRRFSVGICRLCGNYWKVVDEGVAGTDVPRRFYDLWTLKVDLLLAGGGKG
uniref:Formate dehydrogenase accessory protein FdhE n=1 Tax=Thermofilum pendens TaxID=2269 RepID=A0A7C3WJC5_THEPE